MIGGNAYYDYRSEKLLSPQQLGGGFEFFIHTLALRFNGYAPIGTVKNSSAHHTKVALANLQGEVEKEFVNTKNIDFYAALGAYYLTGRSYQNKTFGKTWGSQLRLTARFWKRIDLALETTYDHIFNFRVQGMLSLKIPLGQGRPLLPTRFYRSVIRNETIPIQHRK